MLNHPPNKHDFYHESGITVVVDILKAYKDDSEVMLQGLALLLNIVVEDSQTKISISSARLAVLNSGTGELLQYAQENYRHKEDITSVTQSLISIIGTVWP